MTHESASIDFMRREVCAFIESLAASYSESLHLRYSLDRKQSDNGRNIDDRIIRAIYHDMMESRRARERSDEAFDSKYGVDTGGAFVLNDASVVGPNKSNGLRYMASDPSIFEAALASISIPHEEFTFLDLGSGKGRVLLLAAAHPFRRIIGVEFASDLHDVAKSNLARIAESGAQINRFELVLGDATQFVMPLDPLVIYLFHSFESDVMLTVIRNILSSHAEKERPIFMIYANPVLETLWTRSGFKIVSRGRLFSLMSLESK